MDLFDKVLVCAPTSAAKKYCFEEWLLCVSQLTYPNYAVRVFDNTPNTNSFATYMNEVEIDGVDFMALRTNTNAKSVIERMRDSWEQMRLYAIENGYQWILSLETDVFPPKNVIEELLFCGPVFKRVVGAMYDRDEGAARKLMVQRFVKTAPDNVQARNINVDEEISFVDGSVKEVASCGMGCLLISVDVLKQIKFRTEPGVDAHSDTFFMHDLTRLGVKIYCNTAVSCEHRNAHWGVYGLDYF